MRSAALTPLTMLLCSSSGQVPLREAVGTRGGAWGADPPPSALYSTYVGEGGEEPFLHWYNNVTVESRFGKSCQPQRHAEMPFSSS